MTTAARTHGSRWRLTRAAMAGLLGVAASFTFLQSPAAAATQRIDGWGKVTMTADKAVLCSGELRRILIYYAYYKVPGQEMGGDNYAPGGYCRTYYPPYGPGTKFSHFHLCTPEMRCLPEQWA
jgi:hypothetical protein